MDGSIQHVAPSQHLVCRAPACSVDATHLFARTTSLPHCARTTRFLIIKWQGKCLTLDHLSLSEACGGCVLVICRSSPCWNKKLLVTVEFQHCLRSNLYTDARLGLNNTLTPQAPT